MKLSVSISFIVLWIISIRSISTASSSLLQRNEEKEDYNDTNDTVLRLPLLTHDALKRRRLSELGLDHHHRFENEFESPPQRYNRRRRSRHSSTSRRLGGEDDTVEVGGLYQGYGTHYVDLWVGTPPQRQTVIVDTGSGVTAFPCSACSDCGSTYHADTAFIESDSSTFTKFTCDECKNRAYCSNKNCKLSVSYQEGSSWTAYQASDSTYLGGPHNDALDVNDAKKRVDEEENSVKVDGVLVGERPENAVDFRFKMIFGCQTRITGLFKTQLADGIMGMYITKGALWRQMYDQGVILRQKFSLCFSREAEVGKDGTPAGALTMGGTDTNLHQTPMVYAQGFTSSSSMHAVKIRKMYFMEGGHYRAEDACEDNTVPLDVSQSSLNAGKVIIDSGTTDTYLYRDIANEFKRVFESMVGVKYTTKGMDLTDEQIEKLPSLIIQLVGLQKSNDGDNPYGRSSTGIRKSGLAGDLDKENPDDVLVVISPSRYVDYITFRKKYVPRIYLDERSGSVLGANFMAGHDVLFDIPENNRVGFAESDCDYSKIISTDGDSTLPPSSEVSEAIAQ